MKTLLAIFGLTFAALAHAAISTEQAVAAIIGEAGNQSYTTQVAVACAIRNRCEPHGPGLKGVYGLNNPVVQKATAKVRAKALRAWLASGRRDIVKGCRYFGCPADAPTLIAFGLHAVCMSGAITFYAENI